MPGTDLGELTGQLGLELGGEIEQQDLIDLLQSAVVEFNSESPLLFTLSGTTLDRTASALEQRLLVLFSMLIHLRGQAIYWSKRAIVHSNAAGRTKIDGVEFALSKRANDIRGDIATKLAQLTELGVMADVHAAELGETLQWAPPNRNALYPPYF